MNKRFWCFQTPLKVSDSLQFFEFSHPVILLFPHVIQITQGISQIADSSVPLTPQIITQSPEEGKDGREEKEKDQKSESNVVMLYGLQIIKVLTH